MGKKKKIDNDFNIGFVHFSSEERGRVTKALQSLQMGAVDELGIGRVRDAFADMMFPGISTLHQHAKYFAVLPQIYSIAQNETYQSISEVKNKIIELEKKLTKCLIKGSPKQTTGITGSNFVDEDRYVVYDPTYIYWSGLVAFGIVYKSGSLLNLVYKHSKKEKTVEPKKKDNEAESVNEDFTSFCYKPSNKPLNLKKEINISLNNSEAKFIKEHILTSKETRNSLLAYFLKHNEIKVDEKEEASFIKFKKSKIKDGELKKAFELAQKFSRFIYPIHIRYNYIFADDHKDDISKEILDQFENQFYAAVKKAEKLYNNKTLNEIFSFLSKNGQKDTGDVQSFCERVMRLINKEEWKELDDEIIEREKKVKPERYKLRRPKAYHFHEVHNYMLTYRWETTWKIINEIRRGLRSKE